MNKSDLINKVSEVLNSKKEAQVAVDQIIEAITEALSNNNSVTLVGFGTFSVRDRAARTGRNPQTGAEIQIAAAKVPAFKAGKATVNSIGC